MPKEKSAGAIIYRMEPDGQGNSVPYYLLLRYERGHWEFPKGHIEPGETEEETVKREIFEETGLNDIEIIPGFKEYIKYFFRQYSDKVSDADRKKGKTPWVFKLVVFFVAETKSKDIKISEEHKDFIWLPINEAIKKTTFKNSKLLLKRVNDFVVKTKGL